MKGYRTPSWFRTRGFTGRKVAKDRDVKSALSRGGRKRKKR